jgi:hypothetical protein
VDNAKPEPDLILGELHALLTVMKLNAVGRHPLHAQFVIIGNNQSGVLPHLIDDFLEHALTPW